MSYRGDYGFTDGPVYEELEVAKEDLENLAEKAREEARQAIRDRTTYWQRAA
jgi:hypothetical protein